MWAVALFSATVGARSQLSQTPPADLREEFVPRPELARIAALGFDAALSDYYWLRAVQVLGGAMNPIEHATYFGRVIDVVTTLNPWVDHPYRFAAVWLTDTPENVRTANRLLERGIRHHPDDWRNRFYLGFNHYFYLAENRAGADWLETAVGLPKAPLYLGRLVARLRSEAADGDIEIAAEFLVRLFEDAPDEYIRAEYAKALDEVETERRARRLDAARAEYRRRSGRDITAVEDLLRGSQPVLRALPPELHDWEWVLDEKSGEIVSSYYGKRYQLHAHPSDRERRRRWGVESETAGGAEGRS